MKDHNRRGSLLSSKAHSFERRCRRRMAPALLLTLSVATAVTLTSSSRAMGGVFAAQTTNDLCPAGSIGASTLIEPKQVGESYFGTQCTLAENLLFNISGYALPNPQGNQPFAANGEEIIEPNEITLTNSRIGSGSAIFLTMPIDPAFAAPIHVIITNNLFGLNAAVRFIGGLSPNSKLQLINNQFLLKDRNPFMTDVAMISAFSITYIYSGALPIYGNSTITIAKNKMESYLVGDTTLGVQQYAAAPISSLSGFTFYALSAMYIEDNEFVAKCQPTDMAGCAYGIMWPTIMYGENATWSVQRNKFTIDGGHVGFTPAMQGGALKVAYNDNEGWTNSTGLYDVYNAVWKLRTGTMSIDSVFEAKNNHFQSHGPAVGFVIEPQTDVSRNSHVVITDNSLTQLSGAKPPTLDFYDYIKADQDSSVVIQRNTFSRGDGGDFQLSPIMIRNGLFVSNKSFVEIVGNIAQITLDGVASASSALSEQNAAAPETAAPTGKFTAKHFVDMGVTVTYSGSGVDQSDKTAIVTVDDRCRVSLCKNDFQGKALPTIEAAADPLISSAKGVDICVDERVVVGTSDDFTIDDGTSDDGAATTGGIIRENSGQESQKTEPVVSDDSIITEKPSSTPLNRTGAPVENSCSIRDPMGCLMLMPVTVLSSLIFVAITVLAAGTACN